MNDIVYVGRHALMQTVQRHTHESWEFVYCTYGAGAFEFDHGSLKYQKGEVVAIPPQTPHANTSEKGFRNIHVNMILPTLTLKEPTVIRDGDRHFLLDAFQAALYHYVSDRPERTALLAAYGNLISCYLAAYQTSRQRSQVVEQIEQDIISHYADSGYELDTFLHTLPFSYDYLRRLFQKEMRLTPHRYLNDKRLQMAAEALVNPEMAGTSMADIARMCGFREPLYFSRVFKKKYGVAPSFYAQAVKLAEGKKQDRVILPPADA
ncbi:MAG: AraC family transcriptional regulator [Clostridia bacterium]|nr:AraC family transcriptional regulator [Clostridia bacterium]